MKRTLNRRFFLNKASKAVLGVACTPAIFSNHVFASELNHVSSADSFDLSHSNRERLKVKGRVYSADGKQNLSEVKIEVYQKLHGEERLKHLHTLTTDRLGEYGFNTQFPDRDKHMAPRIYFKLKTNERSYTTELILTKHGPYISDKHWELNKYLGEKVFPKQTGGALNTQIQFNLSI